MEFGMSRGRIVAEEEEVEGKLGIICGGTPHE